ncbi:MAG: universal stress protein [Solirubrobacterales bacterium]
MPQGAAETGLVGYRPGPEGDDTVALVAALVAPGARLIVAEVDLGSTRSGPATGGEADDRLRAALEDLRRTYASVDHRKLMAPPGLPAWEATATALRAAAAEVAADLLVVGATHRGPLARLLRRTLGDRIAQELPCALAVAPNGFAVSDRAGPPTVGVAFDGSPSAWSALAWARHWASLRDGTVRVVTVAEPSAMHHGAALRTAAARTAELGRRHEQALASPGEVRLDGAMVHGDPGDVLIGLSDELDLIVCGSSSHGSVGQLLLGGVSHRLLADAACPVAIIPRPSDS